jgi:hypothetical protein
MIIDGEEDFNFDSLNSADYMVNTASTDFSMANTAATDFSLNIDNINSTTTRINNFPSNASQSLPQIQQDNPFCLQAGLHNNFCNDMFSFGYALNSTTVGDLFIPPPLNMVDLLSLTTESSCGPTWYFKIAFLIQQQSKT